MNPDRWPKASVAYGRELLHSGVEGARSGEQAFLHGQSLTPFINICVKHALAPATIGACLGVLGGCSGHKSRGRAFACGLLGGAIGGVMGLSAGLAWETRRLAESVMTSALRNIGRVRDQHWLEKHPIDYA